MFTEGRSAISGAPRAGVYARTSTSAAMRIWVGAQKPRMLELIGRGAGGWVCALNIYDQSDRPGA